MGLFTDPVTDAERRGWQRRGALALVDLLAEAREAGLPPLVWELAMTSALYGRSLAVNMPERRAEFEAWAAFFGEHGQRRAEQSFGGKTRLRVLRRRYGREPGVDVAVLADIYDQTDG
jgi:hypothetical protein